MAMQLSLKSLSCISVLGILAVIGLASPAVAATPQPGYPVPQIVGPTNPTAVAPGGGGFTLNVYGANFISASVVNWNKQARATAFVSAHHLQAQILASDIASPTAGLITVTTTSPNGPIISSTYAQVEVHVPTTTFSPNINAQTFPSGDPPTLLADINGDGNLDIVGLHLNPNQLQSYLGSSNGVFTPGVLATWNYFDCTDVASGDFNGDGIQDLLFVSGNTHHSSDGIFQVNLGNGDGTFRPFDHAGNVKSGTQGGLFVVGDFNQDGVLDFGWTGNNGLQIFLGNGDGSFRKGKFASSGLLPATAFAADVNGDGKLDLVLYIPLRDGVNAEIRVILGNGDGTFQSPRVVSTHAVAIGSPSLLLSDLNGDGNVDILYNMNGQGGFQLGNGDGTFQPVVILSQEENGIAAADFNSDGKIDLLLVNPIVQSQTLLLGNGDGTFQPGQMVGVGVLVNANSLFADLNNDGLIDLYSARRVYLQQ